jgi:putative CocE/NonD family hydrolase
MTPLRVLRVPALVFLLLAGLPGLPAATPSADTVSPKLQDTYTKREVLIPMRDGVKLFTAIYTPKDRKQAYPILLQRTPYSVAPYGEQAYPALLGPSPRFDQEGFVFVFQDVRGRLMSEGDFVNMRPQRAASGAAIDESTDTYDTIEWVLKHVEGNSGKVGQWGTSYPAYYAATALLSGHPALKAVAPQAPIVDWFQGDDFHRNGALWLPHAFNFLVHFDQPHMTPNHVPPKVFNYGTADGYAWFLRLGSTGATRPLTRDIAFWNQMLDHPDYDAFWQARNLRPHLKDVQPAVLTVGGWFDAENLFGSLQVFKTLERQSPATQSHLVMGPWSHGGWERGEGDHLGPVRFGAKTTEWFQSQVILPFFLQHLKGTKDLRLARATVFETGANRWHHLEAWPPREARAAALYLQPNGQLTFRPPTPEGGADSFISDPAKPVPYTEQVAIGMTQEYMSADQRYAERRPDVLVFQTEPLKEDLTLAGPLRPELFVATTATDADWVVKLVDVYPDDFKYPHNRGEVAPAASAPNPLGGYQQLVRGEVMRGKYRNSLEHPEAFTPDQPTRVAWSMNDVFHTFKKGHRVMVQLQSSWFPLMDRNPQVFMNINQARPEDYRKATHTLFHDAARPSSLGVLTWAPN